MRIPFALAAATLFSLSFPALAYEVDNFTDRQALTEDALGILDAKVNHILRRAVEQANRETPGSCARMVLRQEIVRWVGPDPISLLEFWSDATSKIQHTQVSFKDSVYAEATIRESPAMRFAGIAHSFKLAGHIVGTDKLGHFFMQGLDYYKRVHSDGIELNHVLKYEHGEDGIWGLATSGVKSYSDMTANYEGYLFWNELTQGTNPYVRCENGKQWVKARDFSWADYVSDAWDEAINCSEMVPTLALKVEKRLEKMGLRCPVDPVKCQELGLLDKAEFYVSPVCRGFPKSTQAFQITH
jgi:hypothetical protein